MSPELLGWHERHGLETEQGSAAAPASASPDSECNEPVHGFLFVRTPASAIKGRKAADSSALGKAIRVKTPAGYASVTSWRAH